MRASIHPELQPVDVVLAPPHDLGHFAGQVGMIDRDLLDDSDLGPENRDQPGQVAARRTPHDLIAAHHVAAMGNALLGFRRSHEGDNGH